MGRRLTQVDTIAFLFLSQLLTTFLDSFEQSLDDTLGRSFVFLLNLFDFSVVQPFRNSELMIVEESYTKELIRTREGESVERKEVGSGVHIRNDGIGEGERRRELSDGDGEVVRRKHGRRE